MTQPVQAIVQVAMLEEAQPFLDRAVTVSEPRIVAGVRIFTADFGTYRITLAVSGIGLVNAAQAATTLLAEHPYGVPLISAGTAGGVASHTSVGDVIVGVDIFNLEADAQAFGYQLGQVPGMPTHYESTEALVDAIRDVAHAHPVRFAGIGSGDKFVTSDNAHRIRAQFDGIDAVDMESVAIAQVAYRHGSQFVTVRAVSDLCAPDGTEFLTHLDGAAERSADVVLGALAQLQR